MTAPERTDATCSHPNPPKNPSLGLTKREMWAITESQSCPCPHFRKEPSNNQRRTLLSEFPFQPPPFGLQVATSTRGSRAAPSRRGEAQKAQCSVEKLAKQTDLETRRGSLGATRNTATCLEEGTKDNFGGKQQNAIPGTSDHITVNCENYGINSKSACVCTYDKGTGGTGPRVQPQPLPQASPSIFTNPTPNHGPRS
jgi:hypothetical protein